MKPKRKLITKLLLAAVLATAVTPLWNNSSHAAGDAGSGGYDFPNGFEQQKYVLQSIKSVDEAKTQFGISTDTHQKIDVQDYGHDGLTGDRATGWQPYPGSLKSFRKYTGNPYLQWGTGGGNDPGAFQRLGGHPVRFVLSQIQLRKTDISGKAELQSDGVVWIFQNEYNPKLTVSWWNRTGGTPLSNGDRGRFIFTKNCEEVTRDPTSGRDNIYIAGIVKSDFDSDVFPGDPNSDEVSKKIDQWNLANDTCTVTTGFFASAIGKALNMMKEAINALFNWLKDALLNIVNIGSLNDNAGLVNAWKTMRDFVNLFFILILIGIAFSNILRVDLEKYGVRALLPRLVFAVIAVNFSFLLVQIMVNMAYIIGRPFLNQAMNLLANPPADASLINPSAGFGQFLITLLLVLAVLFGFALMFIFFIARILVIWLLAALSPFVFLFMVLPLTRSLASAWWKNAIKWIFMAPVAFVVLYVAAAVIAEGSPQEDINGPDFLLKIAFFAGAAVAAVMIPLKIGGEVMGHAVNAAKRGGRFGGRGTAGVLGATVGRIPVGDKNLRTRTNAAAYGLGLRRAQSHAPGSRAANRQEEALEHLQEQTALGQGVGRVTGATAGQRSRARQRMLHTYQQEQAQITPAGKARIAYAHSAQNGGPGQIQNGHVFDEQGNDLGALQDNERDFARSQLASEAAFGELAAANHVTEGLNAHYAPSGLAQQNQHNPALAAVQANGTYSHGTATARAHSVTRNDLKQQQPEFWEHANHALAAERAGNATPYQQTVLAAARAYDPQKLAYAMTTGERDSFDHSATRDQVHAFAHSNGFGDARDQVVRDSHNQNGAAAQGALRTGGYIP